MELNKTVELMESDDYRDRFKMNNCFKALEVRAQLENIELLKGEKKWHM